jgi:riboflavin synthase
MFTGLIECVCQIRETRASASGRCLRVDLRSIAPGVQVGDSIAIDGACLTVTRLTGTVADFDVSAETLNCSTIGQLQVQAKVNVERALRLGDRMGGHMVQGHVDGLATVVEQTQQDRFLTMWLKADRPLVDQMVSKGSVAVNGISLTVADLKTDRFCVAVIPETLRATTLAHARVGDRVNIEIDVIVKTVRRYLDTMLPSAPSLTVNKLQQLGF